MVVADPVKREKRLAINRAVTIWTARAIPALLIALAGYASYVLVGRLCVHYLLDNNRGRGSRGTAIALMTVYFILTLLMATCFFRLVIMVSSDPGYLPLGPNAKKNIKRKEKTEPITEKNSGPLASQFHTNSDANTAAQEEQNNSNNVASTAYENFTSTDTVTGEKEHPMNSKDAEKALEMFWKKDVFVCMNDGKPKWCNDCAIWKPDRTHHCSDVGRCVEKMDHFCPWVGGVVAENSFKFFLQFVTYAWIWWFFILIVMAIYVAQQKSDPDQSLDVQFAVLLGISAFFGLFTLGMSSSSLQFAVMNLTTIDNINRKSRTYYLAIYIPTSASANTIRERYPTITYPLQPKPWSPPNPLHPPQNTTGTTETNPANNSNSEIREFAIVKTEAGENPWNLGYLRNFKTVMGNSPLDWILPIKRSPCTIHDGYEGRFQMGSVVEKHRKELGIEQAGDH